MSGQRNVLCCFVNGMWWKILVNVWYYQISLPCGTQCLIKSWKIRHNSSYSFIVHVLEVAVCMFWKLQYACPRSCAVWMFASLQPETPDCCTHLISLRWNSDILDTLSGRATDKNIFVHFINSGLFREQKMVVIWTRWRQQMSFMRHTKFQWYCTIGSSKDFCVWWLSSSTICTNSVPPIKLWWNLVKNDQVTFQSKLQ